jgi:hypothetical protein
MADAFGNYLRDALNNHLRGGTAYSPAATHYYALMTAMPTSAGGGTEVSGGSYARVAFTNNTSNYPAASGGVKQNANPIDWGTASANWGILVGIAVYDASSGGNLLALANLTTVTTINNGNSFQIPASSATFTYDASSAWSTYLQNKILDLVFGATSWSAPATTYFALMTAMPTVSGGGTEASGGAYGRVALTSGTSHWPASSGQLIQNATIIDWGTATANLGSIVGVAEYDASSGGNLLTFKTLTGGSVSVGIGTPFQLPVAGFQDIWHA